MRHPSRHYADAICSLLDPGKEYFGERVVANAGTGPTEGATAAHLIKRLDAQVRHTNKLRLLLRGKLGPKK